MLRRLPTGPGVYLMKNASGRVLYVGKADSLRGRVRSYFGMRGPEDARIVRMVTEVADVDYIVTDTVSEAYLLESNLIKEHRPRFNIRLRDDKSYPFVKITLGEDFPRIVRTRRLVRDGSRYFGPYASASSVDETLKLLRKIFPFRTCNLDIPEGKRVLERPCLLYYINRCQGPCIEAIPKPPYRETIGQIVDFLEGKQEPIAAQLRRRDGGHSEALRYEQAATTRDKLRAVERTMEQQKMAAFSRAEHDVIGMAREEDEACIQVMQVRNGKLIGREHFIVEGARDVTDAEVLGSFLQQYYASTDAVPRALLTPLMPADADDLADSPRRPARRAGHDLGAGARREAAARGAGDQNAVEALERERAEWMADTAKRDEALTELASALGLPRVPERIECYDMSNIQGTCAVGSMVVFIDGRPEPQGVPTLPDPIRRHPRRLPDDGRGAAPPIQPRREAAVADRRPVTGRGRRRRGAGGRRWRRAARPRPEAGPIERDARAEEPRDRLGGAGPRDRRRRKGTAVDGGRRHRTSSASPTCRSPASRSGSRSSICRADPRRSCFRAARRRSTSCSASATRRIGSRSPTTATCAASARCAASWTTSPGSARAARRRCSSDSARFAASARRRWTRWRRRRASAATWRSASRRTWRARACWPERRCSPSRYTGAARRW